LSHKWMQLRGYFSVKAHFGWAHAALSRIRRPHTPVLRALTPTIDGLLKRMERYTHDQSSRFDLLHGTETFARLDVPVSDDLADATRWGYAAINHDFFREIIKSIPVELGKYTFVDIGSGKGAAVLMASEFPFQRLVGVELSADLVEISKSNVHKFNASTGKSLSPEWIQGDFFKWVIPKRPKLFFFNNPFPADLTLDAIRRLESSLVEHPRAALLVFRKAPQSTGDYLHQSKLWKPLRLTPYWRVYESVTV
jgi:hypothetical protein